MDLDIKFSYSNTCEQRTSVGVVSAKCYNLCLRITGIITRTSLGDVNAVRGSV